MRDRHRDTLKSLAVLVVLLAVLTAGIALLTYREYSLEIGLDQATVIIGSTAVGISAFGLALMLLSVWAYGGSGLIVTTRPTAVVLRSGSMPALKSVLEDDRQLRAKLARVRPPGILFLLVVDESGLEIWHGSGRGSPSGALERAAIVSVSPGKTKEGIWTYNSIDFDVRAGDRVARVPFVVRGAGVVLGAGRRETQAACDAVIGALDGPRV